MVHKSYLISASLMKKLLAISIFFGITGCSSSDIKLFLDCELDDRWNESLLFAKRTQFIWYKANNSLQEKNGTVTPYKYQNDFSVTFERENIRGILFNKTDKTLTILNLDDNETRWGMTIYQCKEIQK